MELRMVVAFFVLLNLPDMPTADAIARYLVEQRLAACVNRLSPVHSVYRWRGAVEEASEITLLIKTVQTRYAEVEAAIKMHHPYELPEVIAVPVSAGLPAYLEWISEETKRDINV